MTVAIGRYVEAIRRRGIDPEAVYLYGSRARGHAHRDSDIDVVVVWRGFRRKGYLRTLALLGRAAAEIAEPIQAVLYSPEEFDAPVPGGFLDAIKPDCLKVYERPTRLLRERSASISRS